MGIAGAIVVLAAGAFALLVLPAILTVFGERIAVQTPTAAERASIRGKPRDAVGTGSPHG